MRSFRWRDVPSRLPDERHAEHVAASAYHRAVNRRERRAEKRKLAQAAAFAKAPAVSSPAARPRPKPRTPIPPTSETNLPQLEPLNVTLERVRRGITSVRFGMEGDAQENFTAFAHGNLADLAKRSIGNADHIAAAYLNTGFAG